MEKKKKMCRQVGDNKNEFGIYANRLRIARVSTQQPYYSRVMLPCTGLGNLGMRGSMVTRLRPCIA